MAYRISPVRDENTSYMLKRLLCVTATVLLTSNVFAELSETEQALVHNIDSQYASNLELLEQSVNINSGTLNLKGVKEVGLMFKKHFDQLGFNTEWEDGKGFDRAGHLLAAHDGKVGSPKILLIGHLDTVFAEEDGFQQVEKLSDERWAGPGITDMKGGNVIMLAALSALKSQGLLDEISVRVVLTGDEEDSGKPLAQSKAALIEAGKWADIALGFEDGDSSILTAVTARRGSITWHLTVTGQAAHSSQIFSEQVGAGAVFEAARILDGFRTRLQDEPLLTFNPGVIAGGTRVTPDSDDANLSAFGKSNVVAQILQVHGGLRGSSPAQVAKAKTVMQQVVSENLPRTTATLTFDEGYPPMAQTMGNLRLLAMYDQASQDLGYDPVISVNPRNAGAADISFVADQVDMALDGLGLMGEGGHTKDEIAHMETFRINSQKAAVLMYRLSTRR